jgi:hypothetical protein
MLVIDTSQKVSPNGDLGSENQKQRKQLNQNRSCHKKKEAPPPRPHPYLNELQDLNSGTKKEMNQVYRRKVTTYEHIWRPSNHCWSMSVKPTLGWNSMITLGYSGYIAIICHNAGGMFAYVFFLMVLRPNCTGSLLCVWPVRSPARWYCRVWFSGLTWPPWASSIYQP